MRSETSRIEGGGLRLVFESPMPVSVERLFAFHEDPRALERISPPFPPARVVERPERIALGGRILIRIGFGPLSVEWLAEIVEWDPPHGFADRQVRGPFRSWFHRHRFLPAPEFGTSLLRDEVDLVAPLGRPGALGARAAMDSFFGFRHRRTRELLLAADAGRR